MLWSGRNELGGRAGGGDPRGAAAGVARVRALLLRIAASSVQGRSARHHVETVMARLRVAQTWIGALLSPWFVRPGIDAGLALGKLRLCIGDGAVARVPGAADDMTPRSRTVWADAMTTTARARSSDWSCSVTGGVT